MPPSQQETVTRLLVALQDGDSNALGVLFPLVYEQLHTLARQKRQRWHGDHTLNTTALVHEAYLKLVDQSHPEWTSRAHFFAVAAKAMRHILINYAEKRRAQKRGGDVQKLSLDEANEMFGEAMAMSEERADHLVMLDEALKKLAQVNERQSGIVECRFFGGMTVEETAAALEVSPATVKRGWAMAQVWLYREIQQELEL